MVITMGKFITIHSFKGGTGKSYLAVNLAALYAIQGKKVALLDLDFRAPTLHVVFEPTSPRCWMNNVLEGIENIYNCLEDCSDRINNRGKLFVSYADFSTDAIREMISKGKRWEIEALQRILQMRKDLLDKMTFDIVLADTSPGIQYVAINAVVAADVAVVVSTLDDSDINGTTRMIQELYDVFEKKTAIVMNKVIGYGNFDYEKSKILDVLPEKYKDTIIGVLPCFCEVGTMKRSSIFVLKHPDHPFTKMLKEIAVKIEAV
jgi:MinD-like ATPase involved in chromosome partitioning or flagellar assembly